MAVNIWELADDLGMEDIMIVVSIAEKLQREDGDLEDIWADAHVVEDDEIPEELTDEAAAEIRRRYYSGG